MKKVLGQISLSPTTKKGTNTLICVGVVSVSPGRVLRPSTDACYWDPLELFETQQSYTCSHWGWRRDTVDGSQIRLSSWFGRHPRFLQRFIDPRWRKISYMKNQEYLDPSWRYLQFCAKLKYMGGEGGDVWYILKKWRTDWRDTQGKKHTRISCTNWECWMIFMQYQQITRVST